MTGEASAQGMPPAQLVPVAARGWQVLSDRRQYWLDVQSPSATQAMQTLGLAVVLQCWLTQSASRSQTLSPSASRQRVSPETAPP